MIKQLTLSAGQLIFPKLYKMDTETYKHTHTHTHTHTHATQTIIEKSNISESEIMFKIHLQTRADNAYGIISTPTY